jgi:hypothetical protein
MQHCSMVKQRKSLAIKPDKSSHITITTLSMFKSGVKYYLVSFQGFIILLHEKLDSTLSRVSLHKLRVQLYALVCIFQTLRQSSKLCVARCPITVHLPNKGNSYRSRASVNRSKELQTPINFTQNQTAFWKARILTLKSVGFLLSASV